MGDHFLGNTEAKVTFVVYEDYECEDCGKSYRELRLVREYFKDKICSVFKHFPFRHHPSALAVASIVEACALQHKFIQAHDLVYECQEYLEYGIGGILLLLQKNHFVSIEQLKEDLKKEEIGKKINGDIESGLKCNVKNTPAIFINGDKYEGTLKFDQMAREIEQKLCNDNFDSVLNIQSI